MPVRFEIFTCVLSDARFCRLAHEGNIKAISVFVMAGGDINEADYDGRTALHLATGTSTHCRSVSSKFAFCSSSRCGF